MAASNPFQASRPNVRFRPIADLAADHLGLDMKRIFEPAPIGAYSSATGLELA
ncbi:MAG: hypothetical protein AVDCRST_MAG93-5859 [uncultured Chloroflexia bacterium]|uniref:Uncharacterized protein n=1 Tax=uncultured Chloroflexia bacterium TaxID=1672391 RepID=A0A6J4L7M5_9CHLR|nr:MAG: hypothetical protein AVDCRST_MAG93-5859 [uncultured Chloroflexia bacterium]